MGMEKKWAVCLLAALRHALVNNGLGGKGTWAWGKGDCLCVCASNDWHCTHKHNVIRLVGANTPTEQGNIMILCHWEKD